MSQAPERDGIIDSIQAHAKRLRKLEFRSAARAPGAWISIGAGGSSFGTNVVDGGGSVTVAAFRKEESSGRVWFKGRTKSSGALTSNTLFTLPTGYRPATTRRIGITVYDDSAGVYASAEILVNTTGVVQLFTNAANVPAANDLAYIAGLSYDLA